MVIHGFVTNLITEIHSKLSHLVNKHAKYYENITGLLTDILNSLNNCFKNSSVYSDNMDELTKKKRLYEYYFVPSDFFIDSDS